MRIDCPWCGERPLHEFTYGGDANTTRPQGNLQEDQSEDLAAWMDHVYLRANPAGSHKEYWHHVSGCRSWLIVTRNTTTHIIDHVTFAAPRVKETQK